MYVVTSVLALLLVLYYVNEPPTWMILPTPRLLLQRNLSAFPVAELIRQLSSLSEMGLLWILDLGLACTMSPPYNREI